MMKGNPSAVGQNQKSFPEAASVPKGSNDGFSDRGQYPNGSVSLNLMEFDRVKGVTGSPSAKSFSTPKMSGGGPESKGFSGRGTESEAKPGVVHIGPVIRSNVKG